MFPMITIPTKTYVGHYLNKPAVLSRSLNIFQAEGSATRISSLLDTQFFKCIYVPHLLSFPLVLSKGHTTIPHILQIMLILPSPTCRGRSECIELEYALHNGMFMLLHFIFSGPGFRNPIFRPRGPSKQVGDKFKRIWGVLHRHCMWKWVDPSYNRWDPNIWHFFTIWWIFFFLPALRERYFEKRTQPELCCFIYSTNRMFRLLRLLIWGYPVKWKCCQ